MKKIIKRWGRSLVIRFSPEEMKVFDLKQGDIVELDEDSLKNRVRRKNESRKKRL